MDEQLKVYAYLNNNVNLENLKSCRTVPEDERSERGIVMPLEYQGSTVTLDGITLDVVRRDHQSMDMAYMPMKNFLALDPPVQGVGFYFHGSSLLENLEEIKEAVKLLFPDGSISYNVPDPSELQLAEREMLPILCAGEFLLLLVLCLIFLLCRGSLSAGLQQIQS